MKQEITVGGRRYRPVVLADRWERSYFEYFNENLSQWRIVINWNTREKLFPLFCSCQKDKKFKSGR